MSKTLWYVTKYFSPATDTTPGGRAWFLLKEMAQRGHKVIVITSDSNNLVEVPTLKQAVTVSQQEGVQLVWLKTMKYGVAKSYLRILSWFHFEWNLWRLNKKQLPEPDAIVVSSLSLLTVLNGLWLKRKYKCKLIFEVRDIWPLTIIEEGGVSKYNPFVRFLAWVERLGYKKSDAIIGTMPNLEPHVRNVSSSQAPVYCVPMGVATEQVVANQPLDQDYIAHYLSSSAMKVVHAGTIGITNALEVFFQAAEKMQDNASVQFILVGDGALKQHFIEHYGDLPNVVFAPKVTRSQVASVLEHADIVYFSAFPSLVWEYGQSLNKLIDYMLSATPVVASYSGFPSMVNEAECGYFVPAGDVEALVEKLQQLSTLSIEQRKEMGHKGKDWLLQNRSYSTLANKFSKAVFGE